MTVLAVAALLAGAAAPAAAGTPAPSPTPSQCVGDCDNMDQVTVNELLEMVNIALGLDAVSACAAGDGNGDGAITIDEILKAVNMALARCPLVGTQATEASLGVETSTRDGVVKVKIIDFGVVGTGGQVAVRRTIADAGGAAAFPSCPDGGQVETACDSNDSTGTLTAIFSECRSIDPQTQVVTTRRGTLKQTVADANFCTTGEASPVAPVTSEFSANFTVTVLDAGAETVTQIVDTLTDAFAPSGQGCEGRDGRESIHGMLAVHGGVDNANVRYTYGDPIGGDFVIETASSSGTAACITQQTVNGTLTVDDRTTGRRFFEASHDFVITSQQVDNQRIITEDGALTLDCLGEAQFTTIEPLLTDPRASCPLSGVLEVKMPDGTVSQTRFSPDGVAFDFDGDGRVDKLVASCLDSALTQCTDAIAPPAVFAFVANSGPDDGPEPDTVSVIDTDLKSVVGSSQVGNGPLGIAAAPNGAFVFVVNAGSDTVSVIDAASFQAVSVIRVDALPLAVAFRPNGGLAYVASGGTNSVSVIDTAKALSNPAIAVISRIAAGNLSTGLAASPDGHFIYVTNSGSNDAPGSSVSVIDAQKLFSDPAQAVTTIGPVGLRPTSIAITPDGRAVYVTNRGTDLLVGNTVSVIDPSSREVTSVPVGNIPTGVAVSPDGTFVYVANSGSPNSVSMISTSTNSVGQTIALGVDNDPFFVAFTPDGKFAYVTNNFSDSVSVIDTAAHAVTTTLAVGTSPRGVTVASAPIHLTAGTITVAGHGAATLRGPADITAGPDGNLWFTEPDANNIGRITPTGSITEFPIPSPSSLPTAITAGPDANLWFTEHDANKIGRITPAGDVTEFFLSTGSVGPTAITSGPDGNLWFTQRGSKRVAQITPGGVVTEFATPGVTDVAPRGITTGPDGSLWFTESALNQIGRLSTLGLVQTYSVTTPNSSPAFITAGPDGNIWFSEEGANQIGRITVDGTVTEFSISAIDSQPGVIATGIDGNLWFTEQSANHIGRITPGGTVAEFPAPNPAFGITTGHDGNLWFTDPSANRVARISPGAPGVTQ